MRDIPKHGEVWRHFKNKDYVIFYVGHHSETGEKMVVYMNYDDFIHSLNITGYEPFNPEPCIRPLDMFMSETDFKKYPNAKQKYRFMKIKDYWMQED